MRYRESFGDLETHLIWVMWFLRNECNAAKKLNLEGNWGRQFGTWIKTDPVWKFRGSMDSSNIGPYLAPKK